MLGFIAVVLGAANVFGGFVVTDRMLEMFKERKPAGAGSGAEEMIDQGATPSSTSPISLRNLFILGLKPLARPRRPGAATRSPPSAWRWHVVATLLSARWTAETSGSSSSAIAIGARRSPVFAARTVKMTAMPQMVAIFNGMGGATAALVSLVEFKHKR